MSKVIPNILTRIEVDHNHLKTVKDSLQRFVEDDASGVDFLDWKIEALFQIRDFRNRLAKHFDLEEQGGFFAELLRLAPHAAYRINSIEAEHEILLRALDDTIEWVKSLESTEASVRERLQTRLEDSIRQLDRHKALEHEMMFSAHNQVFGVVD